MRNFTVSNSWSDTPGRWPNHIALPRAGRRIGCWRGSMRTSGCLSILTISSPTPSKNRAALRRRPNG